MPDDRKEKYINPYTDFGFDKLFRQAEIAKYSDAERRQYESSLKEYWDYTSTLETAERKGEKKGREEGRAEGLAEGRAEGRAEGEQSKAKEIARRMKSQGMSDSEISSLTGLILEDIKAL